MSYHEIFNDSYERVTKDAKHFFKSFYKNFTAESEEIRSLFSHVDMNQQIGMLEDSLAYLISFAIAKKPNESLIHIAVMHNHTLRISESMYEVWIQSLIETVKQVDPDYNHGVEMAWYEMLGPGVEFMKYYGRR